MTEDELAFIRAAADRPENDTPRLVFADWLEEHGDEASVTQAHFTRLQCRRNQLPSTDPTWAELVREEQITEALYRRKWNGKIHRFLARHGVSEKVDRRRSAIRGWSFDRGMIGHLTVTPEALQRHADVLFALGPIRGITLMGWNSAIVKLPELRKLLFLRVIEHRPLFRPLQGLHELSVPIVDLRGMNSHFPYRTMRRSFLMQIGFICIFWSGQTTGPPKYYLRGDWDKWELLRPQFENLTARRTEVQLYQSPRR